MEKIFEKINNDVIEEIMEKEIEKIRNKGKEGGTMINHL